MLDPHRQSVLANGCVKPSADPSGRTPGTIYAPKGQVRLLGLLSETNPPQQEEYLDAGDGMLICMKRMKKKAIPNPSRAGCSEPKNPASASTGEPSEGEPNPDPSRLVVSPAPEAEAVQLPEPCARALRPGSFPFHWIWETFSLKGQGVYQPPEKPKKKRSPRASALSVREPPGTPESAASGGKEDRHSREGPGPTPEAPGGRPRAPKRRQPGPLAPGSSLLPLYWKMEARSEARKRQLRQERWRWLQLAQQLLNLEGEQPLSRGKPLSLQQLEEKLRAELLCLATEPEEPRAPKTRTRGPGAKEGAAFKPATNQKAPNFKRLQRLFQEQLMQKKDAAKVTPGRPPHLRSGGTSRTFSVEGDDSRDGEDPTPEVRRLWSSNWRAQSCPELGPPEARPVMHTKASDKRQEANRLLLLEWERRERQEKRRAEVRRSKERRVQQDVARCLATYRGLGHSSAASQRRREELRRQEQQRAAEYGAQLQAMQERVDSRPYLFERVMQANARQAVERRFSQVLATLGIEEETLWKLAARPPSAKPSAKATHKRNESLEDLAGST